MSGPKFTLFVSSVEGATVKRFPTKQLIGARRLMRPVPDGDPRKARDPDAQELVTVWFPDRVIPITEAEERQYGKEYRSALDTSRGKPSLRRRTEAEWKAYEAAQQKAAEAARKAAEKPAQSTDK